MPNPFKRSGNAYLPPEWLALDVGLIRQLAEDEDFNAGKTNFALTGTIGSGKTTALDWYRERLQQSRSKDIALRIDVGRLGVEALRLHRIVLRDLAEVLGEDAHDEAAKGLSQTAERDDGYLSDRQIYAHLGELVEHAENSERRVHLLLDECQFMAEHGAVEQDAAKLREFGNLLKNLAETLRSKGGCMGITITETAWRATPPVVQNRFVELHAGSLSAEEIQRFATMGLTRTGGELPTKINADVGAALSDLDVGVAKIRDVHDLLFQAWKRANCAGAETLTKEHLL